jgi:hypothetical protein
MPLSPPLMLEAGSDTKFQLLPLFNIVGPFLGLTRNLGACHILSTYFTYIAKGQAKSKSFVGYVHNYFVVVGNVQNYEF